MKQRHSWEITDMFWMAARPLLPKRGREAAREYRRKPGGGRPAMDPRSVLEAIFYVLCTGIQWKAIPKTFGAALVVTGANRHEVSQREAVLDSFQVERPDIFETPPHVCLDKGYSGEPALEIVVLRGFIPHIKSRGQEKIEK